MGPAALAQVLQPLSASTHPELLVGLHTSDDAAVFRVAPDLAIVQTIDFFTPIVDEPYTFGAIAAANSVSDVYAMGGKVAFALNVVAFPDDLDPAILAEILRGGADKTAEAGAVIAGGHTVTDDEPKYGLSVTGFVHPDRIWRKAGAKSDDRLLLTKPIGTGVIATALRSRAADREWIAESERSMLTLNRAHSEAAREFSVSACTDVTGFGLLGHAMEMAEHSAVRFTIAAAAVPLLTGALECVRGGHLPGGLHRNREYFTARGVEVAAGIDPDLAILLFDPQTSGGLLFAMPRESADAYRSELARQGLDCWEIGMVEAGHGVVVAS